VAALLPLLAGCSLTTDLDGLSNATAGAGDPTSSAATGPASSGSGATTGVGGAGGGATGSGGAPQTTTGSSTTAGTTTSSGAGGIGCADSGLDNILPNGDMEDGVNSLDGSGWDSYRALLTENPQIPHGGARAINMCATAEVVDDFTAWSDVYDAGSLGGSIYQASICVRTLPGVAPPRDVSLTLREQGGGVLIDHGGVPLNPDDAWQKLTALGTIADPANTKLVLIVEAVGLPGNCLVIDDAVVEKIQ
jgi:hypothetical protein